MGSFIGKLNFDADETLARPVLGQMLEAIHHRGDRAHGVHCAPGIALGWRTAAVPSALKQRGSTGMWGLRALLAQRLPASLIPPAHREFWFRTYIDGDAANEPLEYAVLTSKAA